MARVLTFPSTVFCENCGSIIHFHSGRRRGTDFVIGECENSRCELNDKEFRMSGTWIDVEFVPEPTPPQSGES